MKQIPFRLSPKDRPAVRAISYRRHAGLDLAEKLIPEPGRLSLIPTVACLHLCRRFGMQINLWHDQAF